MIFFFSKSGIRGSLRFNLTLGGFKKKDFTFTFMRRTFLSVVLTFLLFLIPNVLLSSEIIPELFESRVSYWSQGGQNLIGERAEIPFLNRKTLLPLLSQGSILLLDIREADEFDKSHLPNALNIPFSNRAAYYDQLKSNSNRTLVPYCNLDFRAYVAGMELKQMGFSNIAMMYPHGLKGWKAQGLPVAGKGMGVSDQKAQEMLQDVIAKSPEGTTKPSTSSEIASALFGPQPRNDGEGRTRRIPMRILPKRVEPSHISASVGDQLILDLVAEEEDHWFVMPDFHINLHLKKGEWKTVTLNITRSGYFPFGCITCCTQYRCQTKQAVLVDLKEPVASYGE